MIRAEDVSGRPMVGVASDLSFVKRRGRVLLLLLAT
jgi:hypothetical protein